MIVRHPPENLDAIPSVYLAANTAKYTDGMACDAFFLAILFMPEINS
jgi:hypothetical protein